MTINYILIDGSYFIFYRFYALLAWWKLAKPDENIDNPANNTEFIEKFKKTFKDKIAEISKKLKLKNFKILVALDCPRKEIWRNYYFPEYKATRIYDDNLGIGSFFEIGINIFKNELKLPILKENKLEADDCIALYVKYLKLNENYNSITIIANDMDYMQLDNEENINIINLKYKYLRESKTITQNSECNLFCKIIMGDKSDNIPGIFKKCGLKTAIKYFENKELFNKQLDKENTHSAYALNKLIIDFNNIPNELKESFYSKLTNF